MGASAPFWPLRPEGPDVPVFPDAPPRPRPPRRRRPELDLVPAAPALVRSVAADVRSTSPGWASRSISGCSVRRDASPAAPAASGPAPDRPFPPRPRPPRRRRRRAEAAPVPAEGSAGRSASEASTASELFGTGTSSAVFTGRSAGLRPGGFAEGSRGVRGARVRRAEPVDAFGSVSSCCCTGTGATAPGPCGASLRTRESSSGGPPGRGPPGTHPGPAKPAPRLSSLAEVFAARWPRARRAGLGTQHSNRRDRRRHHAGRRD